MYDTFSLRLNEPNFTGGLKARWNDAARIHHELTLLSLEIFSKENRNLQSE